MNSTIINNIKTMLDEKDIPLDSSLEVDGHTGLEIIHVLEFISQMPEEIIKKIHRTFIEIDFKNKDTMDYINFLAKGMIESLGC